MNNLLSFHSPGHHLQLQCLPLRMNKMATYLPRKEQQNQRKRKPQRRRPKEELTMNSLETRTTFLVTFQPPRGRAQRPRKRKRRQQLPREKGVELQRQQTVSVVFGGVCYTKLNSRLSFYRHASTKNSQNLVC